MNSFVKLCSFCGEGIEMSNKNGRWQAFEESGQYHKCKERRTRH